MDPLKYICSEELIKWWETDLCQLLDDIEKDNSNRLVNLIRVQDIDRAAFVLGQTLEGLF